MAQETGHSKNVANFAQVISIVESLGAKYNPSNNLIKPVELQTSHSAAENAVADVTEKEAAEDVAVNERQEAFESLSKLTTRIGNAASAAVNDSLFNENVKSITRKLSGRRASAKPDASKLAAGEELPKTISASQMSFDNRIQNFAELIALLKTQSAYAPNETDLQAARLESVLSNLQTKNTNAQNASIAAANARTERNRLLYNDPEGIVPRASLVKTYIKSLGDDAAAQYKQIVAMKFKKL